jgi:hypothetical protein
MNSPSKTSLRISELWGSQDEEKWRRALAAYWESSSVKKNLKVETFIDELDSEVVRRADSEGWRAFLRVYFHWKFPGIYLNRRLADLERNEPERLFLIKDLLFTSDPANVRKAVERARYIKGLGPAGASGLLAVLFPRSFGTADQFVVKGLLEVPSLPERAKLVRMNPKNLTDDDAVLLIEIMRRKAKQLNELFRTEEWTPRKIDKILWTLRDGDGCR